MTSKRTRRLIAAIIVFIIALQFNAFSALFALIFLGIVPGTNISIPPTVMMILYPLAIGAAIYWLARQPLYIGSQEKQEKTARAVARKRVAKKTTAAKRKPVRV